MKITLTRTRLLTILFIVAVLLKVLSLLLSGHGHPLMDKMLSGLMLDILLLRVIILVHGTYGHYRQLREQNPIQDFPELLLAALQRVIRHDKVCRALATEITLVYYAFFKWGKRDTEAPRSWYGRQGLPAIYGVFIFLFLLEMTGMGLLLPRLHYPMLHRLLLAAGAYSVVFLLAQVKAVCARPIQVDDNGIYLRYGLVTSLYIPFEQVKAIRDFRGAVTDHTLQLSLLKVFEPCNLALELKRPISVHVLFKKKKQVEQIVFRVDTAAAFREMLIPRITC
ncbi:hypothetical protein [Chitinophaga qingshengii]|uniref:Beta-carotene 15,15'-monooxygenase n=1 Tax=Chitinophaga qingshengii TaxID=1569794 RepID=A0ABR7TTQ5_9BACT|nr:hypothetical protein [Chitinophaga qingshengii]MBC9933856.1 hypothetical protein [Chitinophaga qingshengii]